MQIQITDTYRLFSAIDIFPPDDGVLIWTWRDVDLDLGIGGGEGGEEVCEEDAVEEQNCELTDIEVEGF